MRLSKNLSILLLSSSLSFIGCKQKDNAAAPPTESSTATKPAKPRAAPTPAAPTPTPAAGSTIASDDDYIKSDTALLDKLVSIIKAADTNCDKLAEGITKMIIDNNEELKASRAYEKAHPNAKTRFDEATQDKQAAFEAVAVPALATCKDNKKLEAALTKLFRE